MKVNRDSTGKRLMALHHIIRTSIITFCVHLTRQHNLTVYYNVFKDD